MIVCCRRIPGNFAIQTAQGISLRRSSSLTPAIRHRASSVAARPQSASDHNGSPSGFIIQRDNFPPRTSILILILK